MSIIDKIRSIFSGKKEMVNDQEGEVALKDDEKISVWKFPRIDVNQTARNMKLEMKAQHNANLGLPTLDSLDFDVVEQEIVTHMKSVQDDANSQCNGKMKGYRDTLDGLDFDARLGEMDNIINTTGKEFFQNEFDNNVGYLNECRSELNTRKGDLSEFKKDNELKREAHPYTKPQEILSAGIIVVLFLIESFANTSFLAKGNELGWVGAFSVAIGISFINLGVAYLCGRLTANIVHIHWSRKIFGVVCAGFFVVFAIGFNLMVAHYREATGTAFDEGARIAISTMREDPLGLKDFQSWILFFMGGLFAIISFIDGVLWGDPYPGYGKRARLVKEKEEEYREIYGAHKNNLYNKYKDAIANLHKGRHEIMGYVKRFKQVRNFHKHFIQDFEEHLKHIQDAGNLLLQKYRTTNATRRGGQAPARFKDKWEIQDDIQKSARKFPDSPSDDDVSEAVKKAEKKLKYGQEEIGGAYNEFCNSLEDKYGLDSLSGPLGTPVIEYEK